MNRHILFVRKSSDISSFLIVASGLLRSRLHLRGWRDV